MALIIQPTQNKKIYIQGTSIELPQIYNRLEFGCRANGATIEIAFYTYIDYASYKSGSLVSTNILVGNLVRNIDTATQTQNLTTAHELAKAYYEELGYQATIQL